MWQGETVLCCASTGEAKGKTLTWFKGEPIIRIRIRTAIIRIRTTDTRILRIIRIRTGEELMGNPETPHTRIFLLCCNKLDFLVWLPQKTFTLGMRTGADWGYAPYAACFVPCSCPPTFPAQRGTHNSYSYSHRDKAQAHNGHPHSPKYPHPHRRGADTIPSHYHL